MISNKHRLVNEVFCIGDFVLTGGELGALDLLFDQLVHQRPLSQRFLDLGTSALEHSNDLRLPLIFQKEGFGARAVCFDTYEWTLTNG